ncbi:M15 family metallopeptidase [Pigmentibacter sp. JX0631]|uniref:M15 family metallopeptidase n=1 Tax=Pigmentibacter sp. JX0631 TaxID=2976982 RepID=UPI00246948DB|nr:M15 family metallopeptidase [Pigmentibacter sp. JX0631]WGL58993.1 M15 family metallopeptidase [Pigmentibacter sp. JX0631]
MKKKICFFTLFNLFFVNIQTNALEKGFVYLKDIDPTIKSDLRYLSTNNFTNQIVPGYKKPAVILTKEAAEALKCAQQKFNKDNYSIVVYDAYRPQTAVNFFMKWSKDLKEQEKKSWFYPRVDKVKVFELGYVASKSGHSRGSTVDISLIKKDKKISKIVPEERKYSDGMKIYYLNDGTEDFGSSFDLFDLASHYENDLISKEQQEKRLYLKNVMDSCGFNNYKEEWWHFTLRNEPFPETYFDFSVE